MGSTALRLIRPWLLLLSLASGIGLAQDAFPEWYPEQLRFTLEIQFDDEVMDVATYWVGERALRAETESTTFLLTDEDGPVLYFIDEATGSVDRMDDPDLTTVGTLLPFGSADHPCMTVWECERTGDDTIDGRAVEVWDVQIPGLGDTTVWIDVATRVQLRSRGTTDDGTVVSSEVIELDVGPQAADLFTPPVAD